MMFKLQFSKHLWIMIIYSKLLTMLSLTKSSLHSTSSNFLILPWKKDQNKPAIH